MAQWFYDRGCNKIELDAWLKLWCDYEYRRVAMDLVGDVEVSTVWMGVDHNPLLRGDPLIFETMVFGGALHHKRWRWSSESKALRGHAEVICKVVAAGRSGEVMS